MPTRPLRTVEVTGPDGAARNDDDAILKRPTTGVVDGDGVVPGAAPGGGTVPRGGVIGAVGAVGAAITV